MSAVLLQVIIGSTRPGQVGEPVARWFDAIAREHGGFEVALQLEVGTVWVNDWAVLQDQFEEGGFKGSGQGRMRGTAVIDDFIEYKHIQLHPGTATGR